jgi:mono/diheme cytochrome c family protein
MVRWSLGAWMAATLVSTAAPAGTHALGDRWLSSLNGFRFVQDSAGDEAGLVRRGAALYAQGCADCHGADATGEVGPDLTGLWTSGKSDDRVFETIRFGRPGSIMPPSLAPDDDVRALVAYLKGLGTAGSDEVAVGDAGHGEVIFRSACATCHQVNEDDWVRICPESLSRGPAPSSAVRFGIPVARSGLDTRRSDFSRATDARSGEHEKTRMLSRFRSSIRMKGSRAISRQTCGR